MSRILAIGSSHLASFKLGVNIANKQSQLLPEIDFAGIWETGFGYLKLDGANVLAPDLVPQQNNANNVNLRDIWTINDKKSCPPNLNEYSKILIFASPCKLLPSLYYQRSIPAPLSSSTMREVLRSNYMDHHIFDLINPWQFRISKIVQEICNYAMQKVVFVGAPLPIEGMEDAVIEAIRKELQSNQMLAEIHKNNVHKLRQLSEESFKNIEFPYSFILPPETLLCDMQISTKKHFLSGNMWHTNGEYGLEIIKKLIALSIL